MKVWSSSGTFTRLPQISRSTVSVFEQACEVFFDPLVRLVDAGVEDEARDALLGEMKQGSLLFVVHIEREGEAIRMI
jgi:uncharacterized DUF497 family protein